ncbi:hypothetical protein QR680_006129 [Steinernema hermaphroditum]|uniref:Uncharacterized protein n=1 Tax=Steinernema hermaphroditum TaxID=289476 RepID=A0AA39HWT7_9BILA|nr:hypothetical protein QR680_006129 [Steinernema hermaphroditum]
MARLSEDVLIKIIENCDGQTVFEGTRTASSALHALSVKYGPKIELTLKIDLKLTRRDRREKDSDLNTEELCRFAMTHRRLFQIKDVCIEHGDLQDERQFLELEGIIKTFGLHGLNVDLKLNIGHCVKKFTQLYQQYHLHAKTLRLKLSSQAELDQILFFLISNADEYLSHNAAVFLKVHAEISVRDLFEKGNVFAKALSIRQHSNLHFLSLKAVEPELAEFVEIEKQFHRFKKSQSVGYSVDYSYGVNIRLAQAFNTSKISFDDKMGLDSGVLFECKITAQKPVLLRLIMLGVIDTIMGIQCCKLRAGESKTFTAKPRKRGDDEPEIGYCIPIALITFVELSDDSNIEEDWINLYSGVEMPETKIEECPFSIEAVEI